MAQHQHVLAIDFGTSNSAVGVCRAGTAHILEMETGAQTLPTALFFDFEEKQIAFGSAAEKALFEGAWGRYMRALKSRACSRVVPCAFIRTQSAMRRRLRTSRSAIKERASRRCAS